jgi:hypothetical protein
LVRNLEGRRSLASLASPNSSVTANKAIVDALAEGRAGLSRLFREHSSETELLNAELVRAQQDAQNNSQALTTEKKINEQLKNELVDSQLTLQDLNEDNSGAARVVARYMSVTL